MDEERPLAGGVGNDGLVVRVGDTVRRPWAEEAPATQALLAHLAQSLPGAAPAPQGRDEQGRQVLSWVDGDVALPPFAPWATSDAYLVGLGELLRRVHDALDGWVPPLGVTWSSELADPEGGSLIVHADICPENVVARQGMPFALLDWEFAAPGRRIWDLVSTARLCVPFVSPARRRSELGGVDVLARFALLVDSYGLDAHQRRQLPYALLQRREVGERFVRGRVAAGQPSFVSRWAGPEGDASHRREQRWLESVQGQLAEALSLD